MRLEHDLRLRVREADDQVGELEVGRGALGIADVKGLANRGRVLGAAQDAIDEVRHEAPRADLRAVVEERDRQVTERLQRDAADGTVADLARAIDVERTHDRQRQTVFTVVRVREMLGRQLAGGIHPTAFADRPDRREVVFLALVNEGAVNLAGRELDKSLHAGGQCRLHDLVRAQQVDLHRPHGAAVHGIDAGDGRAVDHDLAAVDGLARGLVVEHIPLDEMQVLGLGHVRKLERVAVQVVVDHDFVVGDQLRDQVRADEAGAAGDANSLVLQSHGKRSSRS